MLIFSLPRFLQSHFTEDLCVRGGTEGQSEGAAAEKRRVNTGKPHNASESFCSEVAHVTSGYISLAKESCMTNSDINKGKSIILPQNGAVNILNNIAIYHRPTKQKYEAKNLDINEN